MLQHALDESSCLQGELQRLMVCAWANDEEQVIMEVQASWKLVISVFNQPLIDEFFWVSLHCHSGCLLPACTPPARKEKALSTRRNPLGDASWWNSRRKDTRIWTSTGTPMTRRVVLMRVWLPVSDSILILRFVATFRYCRSLVRHHNKQVLCYW